MVMGLYISSCLLYDEMRGVKANVVVLILSV